MRKLGIIFTAVAASALLSALGACSSSNIGDDNNVAWFSATPTVRVDVNRARNLEPAIAPRR